MKSSSLRSALIAALGFTLVVSFAATAGDAPPEPDSYRQSDYRAPTPATLKGARVLTTDEAAAIWRAGDAAFIDVLPQAPRPKDLPADVVWRDKPRSDIPGSLWLPDTGYGELAPVMLERYMTWIQGLRDSGRFMGSYKLHDQTGRRLTIRGGEVIDGPFIESKDAIGGIFIIDAASLDEAAEIARSCPCLDLQNGYMEVRVIEVARPDAG